MGYYTYHELSVYKGDSTLLDSKEFKEFFEKTTDYCLDSIDEAKWYESSEHMKIISKAYPTTIFALSGDGEASDDNWISYFFNGKECGGQAELVYPDIDYKELGISKDTYPEYFI